MTATSLLLVVGVVLLILAVGGHLISAANRLDRLHVRTDGAWAALVAALERRAVVARAIATGDHVGRLGPQLRSVADDAESATRAEREVAENELTSVLARIDRQSLPDALATELSEAEQRVVIARRVHTDAVRDTLALRRRRKVRFFRLAGTAPEPTYFEIAEPERRGS